MGRELFSIAKENEFLKSPASDLSPHRRWAEANQSGRYPAVQRAPVDMMISDQLGHCIMDTAANVCSDAKKQQRIWNQSASDL